MSRGESVRKGLAAVGFLFWLGPSFLPLLGGNAKHTVRCRGRAFTGRFDDCFNDYIPLPELGAPFLALLSLYPVARFAFSVFVWADGSWYGRWRPASRYADRDRRLPLLIVSGLGCLWALWRMVLYPLDRVTLPFLGWRRLFAIWFGAAAWCTAPGVRGGR